MPESVACLNHFVSDNKLLLDNLVVKYGEFVSVSAMRGISKLTFDVTISVGLHLSDNYYRIASFNISTSLKPS